MRKTLIATALVAAALTLAGCNQSRAEPDPVVTGVSGTLNEYRVSTFGTTLPSGRDVECVIYVRQSSTMQCFLVDE